MYNKLPEHAKLPLWADKNDAEKSVVFSSMLDDLNVYRQALGLSPITLNYDDGLDRLMAAYKQVFNPYHQKIKEALYSVKPYDEIEAEHIRNTIEFLDTNPNALNMNCERGHITGSAIIVDVSSRKILLHRHKKYNRYLQFGGHPDYEFFPFDIALRESKEESGLDDLSALSSGSDANIPIDVDIHVIPEKDGKPEHPHYDLRYALKTASAEMVKAHQGESGDFVWLDIPEALAMSEDVISYPLKRLIRKISYS